jgi:hypothetical protein
VEQAWEELVRGRYEDWYPPNMSEEKKEDMLAFAFSQVRQTLQDPYTTGFGSEIIFS